MAEQIIIIAAYCICIAFAWVVGVMIAGALVTMWGLVVIAWELIKSYLDW